MSICTDCGIYDKTEEYPVKESGRFLCKLCLVYATRLAELAAESYRKGEW